MQAFHVAPPPNPAAVLLSNLEDDHASGKTRMSEWAPMSRRAPTLLCALYRMGYRATMTAHGFRSVASTILHEQGWPHEHIEFQLAHQERTVISAAHNHALYLAPRAKMMHAWADHLQRLRQDGMQDGSPIASQWREYPENGLQKTTQLCRYGFPLGALTGRMQNSLTNACRSWRSGCAKGDGSQSDRSLLRADAHPSWIRRDPRRTLMTIFRIPLHHAH